MSDKKEMEQPGITAENTVYDSMQNQPEMAKATFSVKSEWNGDFSVTSNPKGFRIGGQNIVLN